MEPRGRSGWLAWLIFILSISPLVVLGQHMNDLGYAERHGAVWPDGFRSVYLWSVGLASLPLCYAGLVLYRRSTWKAVTDAVKFMWIGYAAINFVPAFVLTQYFPGYWEAAERDVFRGATGSLLALGIWTTYLFKSKRVRNTYVNE